MYSAKFVANDGKTFYFDYDHSIIFDIDPLSELDVSISTSQGFQQIGNTIEGQSVEGISRTITGKIIGQADAIKRQLLSVFAPFTSGRLYFNEKYFCDATVQKVPAIGVKHKDVSFSLLLYCAYPYWQRATDSSYMVGQYDPAFSFPVLYDSHIFGTKSENAFVNCYNGGAVPVPFDVEFTSEATVTNYGIINVNTLEELRLVDTLNVGESVRVYRESGRLHVEKTVDGETEDAFSLLDEDSTLFSLEVGDNVIRATADSGADNIVVSISFRDTYAGVYDGM